MSGGLRTSVKSDIIAKQVAEALEINTVREDETSTNVTGNSTAADSVVHPPPLSVSETSKASASYGFNVCDGNIPCLPMLSSAAKSMGTTTRAESPPHAGLNSNFKLSSVSVPSTPRIEGEILLTPTLKSFSFNELKKATRNFRFDLTVGEGVFGCVFRGWVNGNSLPAVKPGTGMDIAVKRLNQEGLQDHEEWLEEINYLEGCVHPNLVKLIGYCSQDDKRFLVYEFIPCGSLDNHLFGRGSYSQPLTWTVRMKISLGAAKVLAFFHSDEAKVIHRNFNSSMILLDSNYNAKLSSLGLAKDGPAGDRSHVSARVMGTIGLCSS
ncbi:hypothetical protein M0R45_037350 [Rubus argutus]|uniref:non-specific serine/threonine protein kinase n=1 Tax=Rubus argutus TaxID=59490 RepID=A0AAW1W396_RUBAR